MKPRFRLSLSVLALDEALRRVEADRGSLMAVDAEHRRLHIVAARGITGQVRRQVRVPVGAGLCGAVVQQGRPLAAGVGTPFNSRRRLAHRYLTQSFLVPVAVADTVIGVMNLARIKAPGGMPPERALQVLERVVDEFAPSLAYEWLAGSPPPAFPQAAVPALASCVTLTRALRTVVAAGVKWSGCDVVCLVLTPVGAQRPPAAMTARRNVWRAGELDRRLRRGLEKLTLDGDSNPAPPEPLMLPDLLALAPVVAGTRNVGWVSLYAAQVPRRSAGRDEATEKATRVAERIEALLQQNRNCRLASEAGSLPSPPSVGTIERAKFDALITTVCHEVNNPVGGILGIAELLQLRDDLAGEVRARLADIQEEALRVGEFTSKLARLRAVAAPRLVDVSGTRMLAVEDTHDLTPTGAFPP